MCHHTRLLGTELLGLYAYKVSPAILPPFWGLTNLFNVDEVSPLAGCKLNISHPSVNSERTFVFGCLSSSNRHLCPALESLPACYLAKGYRESLGSFPDLLIVALVRSHDYLYTTSLKHKVDKEISICQVNTVWVLSYRFLCSAWNTLDLSKTYVDMLITT